MIDKDRPDRQHDQSIKSSTPTQDTALNNTEEKDLKTSNSYIATHQENKFFASTQQTRTVQICGIDDIKNQSSFFSWLNQYVVNYHDLKDTKNEVNNNFSYLSNYLSKVIAIITTVFTISVFTLIVSPFFFPHLSLILIGISSLSCLITLIAVSLHLSQIHLYKIQEEDINLIEQKYVQGKIAAIFEDFFDNEKLNIEENINYNLLAMHIKETAESAETFNQYLKLHNIIQEVIYNNQKTEQLNESIDENLKQITNLTINLLNFLFSKTNTQNEDQKVIDFLNKAKVNFVNQCNDVHKIKKLYNLLYDILLPDKELIIDKNLEDSVNDIQTKTINAIDEGIKTFINNNSQDLAFNSNQTKN
jgi:hypothetical protein